MDSQESDLLNQDDYAAVLNDSDVNQTFLEMNSQDWAAIRLPDPLALPSSPTGELPSNSTFMGKHLFEVNVDTSVAHKKSYVLSQHLNKLYIDMGKIVPIRVKWDGTENLFVRALMVFTQPDHQKSAVRRCVVHRDASNVINQSFLHVDHVLAADNLTATYDEDPNSKRCSVVVPLTYLQQGCDYFQINYKFMCKTSCTGGINRSLTDIIFTLEDVNRQVVGRQKLSVKICSCPKRDKDKEEENLLNFAGKKKSKVKREAPKTQQAGSPETKKIKTENYEEIVSFAVSVKGQARAEELKTIINNWNRLESLKVACPTAPIPEEFSVVTIHEDIAFFNGNPYGET